MGTSLRNLDDGEVVIRGRDGVMRGEDARLFRATQVQKISKNSNLLDLVDARNELLETHVEFRNLQKLAVS